MFEHRPRVVLLVAAVTMAVDWLVKFIAVSNWQDDPVDLGWMILSVRRNEGIAFSIGDGLPVGVVLAVTGAIVALMVVLSLRGLFLPSWAAGLIVGGGMGNLVDRAVNGAVIDMFDLGWWPSFNVADVALNVGVGVILLWSILYGDRIEEQQVQAQQTGESDG